MQGPTGAVMPPSGGTIVADNLTSWVSVCVAAGVLWDVQTGLQPSQVAVADVNGDGNPDLVSGNINSVTYVPSMNFVPPPPRTDFVPPGGAPFGVAIGDLDGDGKADVAVATQSNVKVYRGTSTGPSVSPTTLPLPPVYYNATNTIRIADVNGDGRLDIVVGFLSDSASFVIGLRSEFLGDGAGGFGPHIDIHGAGGGEFALGDVNGDGRPDLGAPSGAILLTPSATRTVLAASPSPVAQGSAVTLTATVPLTRVAPPSSTAGTVKFYDGTTLLGGAPVSWTTVPQSCNPPYLGCTAPTVYYGTATALVRFLHPGSQVLSAVYSGDGSHAGSISAPITERVQQAPLAVGGEPPVALAIDRLPNPATSGRLRVAFSLPSSAPATLELFDLDGRRIVAQDASALGAGRHELILDGGRSISSGIYFVRLQQGSRTASERVAVVR